MLRKWQLKAAVQGFVSCLPASHRLNQLFQKYVTGSDRFAQRAEGKLRQMGRHLRHFETYSARPFAGARVLEIGTGTHPLAPLALYVCGAGPIVTFDVAPLVFRRSFVECVRALLDVSTQASHALQPRILPDRLRYLADLCESETGLDAMFEKVGITRLVAKGFTVSDDMERADFILTSDTLEHIPQAVLPGLFASFRRISHAGTLMSHSIAMGDHYANTDSRITHLNYLRYSDRQWRFFNNSLHYQNRLRLSDYVRLHEAAGFEILLESFDSRDKATLATIPLAARFRGCSEKDLLAVNAWLVSRPRPDAG